MLVPLVGTRIELVHMPDDPNPVPAGTQGTVDYVSGPHQLPGDRHSWHQVGVKWDNGRTLSIILPKDTIRVLGSQGDFVTRCPKGHQLYVKTLTLRPHHKGVPVHADGFTYDNDADTEDEVVTCFEAGCPDANLQTVQ
jgi:hypothetical protein